MKVILLEKINKLSSAGDIISIKNGYAKNYILPNKKGLIATTKNIENIKNNLIDELNKETKKEIKNYKFLNNLSIVIPLSVKKNEDIYGSFNLIRLSKVIKKLDIKLNIKNIETNFSVKKIGNYKITFKNKKTNLNTEIYLILLKANK